MTTIEQLVYASVFNPSLEEKGIARREIRLIAKQMGIYLASIHEVYMKRGRGELTGFTVPAFNIRNLTFDFARLIFRLMKEKRVGYVIFEIARGEVGYTDQTHDEYATSVLAGAIAEEYEGPVYIQADHTQFSAEKYAIDPLGQTEVLKKFISSAVNAGFYNIDIDASTLVDLSRVDLTEQQKNNFSTTAELTQYIRSIEPEDIIISIGGEIGHIGGKNSTVEDFRAFMRGFNEKSKVESLKVKGLSKVSVQTGTSHGGIVLPDGSIKQAEVDFDVIQSIGKVAKEEFGMGGVVQHGASTLPTTLFNRFPAADALEIHLATGFQNIMYENIPPELKKEIYTWLDVNCAGERKSEQTDEQFHYITRKRANGQFKETLWKLDQNKKLKILNALETEVRLIFHELGMENTV
jgi:fructose/tagatose bisphosphate aldolase